MNALTARLEAAKREASGKMSPAQKRAMMKEIKKQCAEYWRAHETELVGLILWELHTQEGWGVKRLRRFWENFMPAVDELLTHYEMDEKDKFWICGRKLLDIGVDIEAWQNEVIDDESQSEKEP